MVVSGPKWYKMFIYNYLRRVIKNENQTTLREREMDVLFQTVIYTSAVVIASLGFALIA